MALPDQIDVDISDDLTPEQKDRKINEAIKKGAEGIYKDSLKTVPLRGTLKLNPSADAMNKLNQVNQFAQNRSFPTPTGRAFPNHMASPNNDPRRALAPNEEDNQTLEQNRVSDNSNSNQTIEENESRSNVEKSSVVEDNNNRRRQTYSTIEYGALPKKKEDKEIISRKPATVGNTNMPHNSIPKNNLVLPNNKSNSLPNKQGGVPSNNPYQDSEEAPNNQYDDSDNIDNEENESSIDGSGKKSKNANNDQSQEANSDKHDDESDDNYDDNYEALDENFDDEDDTSADVVSEKPKENDTDNEPLDYTVDSNGRPVKTNIRSNDPRKRDAVAVVGENDFQTSSNERGKTRNNEDRINKPNNNDTEENVIAGKGYKPNNNVQNKSSQKGEGRPNMPSNPNTGVQGRGAPHNSMPTSSSKPASGNPKPVQGLNRRMGESGDNRRVKSSGKKKFARNKLAKAASRKPPIDNGFGGRSRFGSGGSSGDESESREKANLKNAKIKRERKKRTIRMILRLLPFIVTTLFIFLGTVLFIAIVLTLIDGDSSSDESSVDSQSTETIENNNSGDSTDPAQNDNTAYNYTNIEKYFKI